MTDSKDIAPTTKGIGDSVHSLVKVGISAIPALTFIPVGGLAAEIFNLFVVPPYQKRIERWMNMVTAELDELRRSDLVRWEDYEDLLKRFSEDREVKVGREEFRLFCNDLGSRLLVRFSRHIGEFEGVYNPGVILREGEDLPMLKVTDLGLKLLTFVKDHKKNDEKEGDRQKINLE